MISCDVKIGNHVIINTHSFVAHDVCIEDYVQIYCNTSINGGAKLERGSTVCSNACVLPSIIMKKNSILGASSVLINNSIENKTMFGVPARVIK